MVDVLPITFPVPGEPGIASYSYQDIADGIGYKEYYGVQNHDDTYSLITFTDYSKNIYTGGFEGIVTFNFNTNTFNLPRTIKGDAYVRIPVTDSGTAAVKLNLTFYKVSGGVSTAISSTASLTALDFADYIFFVKMPMTQTNLKKGDYIKLTVASPGSGDPDKRVFHDPMARGSTATWTSQMRVLIPFRIDL